jgi:hypothetical protein
MRTFQTVGVALCAALFAVAAQAAGVVKVSFVQPDNFTDVKDSLLSKERNLNVLKRHIEQAAAPYVADGQTLTVEVLDVDLAGDTRHSPSTDLRVLRGGADWPRIQLRYALESPGQPARRGEARVQDMGYLTHRVEPSGSQMLVYERRMLDAWFRDEFAAPKH